jgi:hypothetical protein
MVQLSVQAPLEINGVKESKRFERQDFKVELSIEEAGGFNAMDPCRAIKGGELQVQAPRCL